MPSPRLREACVIITGKVLQMAVLNELITKNPEVLGGTPVFFGTRVPFQNLLDYLEAGQTIDEFLDDFPTVTRQTAIEALEHAKALVLSQLR
jgi:uncharacterized protein (DUF433 family)